MNVRVPVLVLLLLAVEARAELQKECTPGETKQLDCNSCFCSQAGVWGCTQVGCQTIQLEVTHGEQATRVRRSAGHCVPNTTYTEESSTCVCNSDGSRARCYSHATREASCTPGATYKESVHQLRKQPSIQQSAAVLHPETLVAFHLLYFIYNVPINWLLNAYKPRACH